MAGGRYTAARASSRRIRTGAILSCSTNTSTATMVRDWVQAIRRDGQALLRGACISSRPARRSNTSNSGGRPLSWKKRRSQLPGGGADMREAQHALSRLTSCSVRTRQTRYFKTRFAEYGNSHYQPIYRGHCRNRCNRDGKPVRQKGKRGIEHESPISVSVVS